MSQSIPILQVQELYKDVPGLGPQSQQSLRILQHINLTIYAGETVAIVGPSGSGKSTLLGLLAGLDQPSGGSVELDGESLYAKDEDARAILRAQKLGFVFQAFQLLPTLTALENVMLPLEIIDQKNARSTAMEVLDRVGLKNRQSHYPNQLSGGEQQRVAIARAFAPKPKILLADEPTGNLDTNTGQRVIDLLFDLNEEQGTTLVLVTHDLNLAKRCQRELKLDEGALLDGAFADGVVDGVSQ